MVIIEINLTPFNLESTCPKKEVEESNMRKQVAF